MLNDEVIKTLNELFTKFKIPMKIKDLFLYRPVFHQVPFEDCEVITETGKLAVCNSLCIEFDYEYNGYNFSYHIECKNVKGAFHRKEMWLKGSDIYPVDRQKENLNEREITKKSKIGMFSILLLRQLSLLVRDVY
jgi:hypothetical protein